LHSTHNHRVPRAGVRARADGTETIEIHTAGGPPLFATVREPPRGVKLAGTAVLAHAMFARRSEFERRRGTAGGGLAPFLCARGWRTIAFDFRGHGDSGAGAASGAVWSYDDLVREDLPAVTACARARSRRTPVVVVGHSLGGHVALAAAGTGALDADAIAMFGANVWLRALEPSRVRWAVKRTVMAGVDATCRKVGYFPARALRMGSDDEPSRYMGALSRAVREGRWGSDDGRVSYEAALAAVKIPVRAIASEGDRLNCHPDCAAAFVARCGGPTAFDCIDAADDGGKAPGHMEMVTTDRAARAWTRLERWMAESPRAG
jgi:predicted alpha/beta hydrolase